MPTSVRAFHERRTVLNKGVRGVGDRDLSQPWFVVGHQGVPPCISKLLGGGGAGPLVPCYYAYVFSFASLVCDTGYH